MLFGKIRDKFIISKTKKIALLILKYGKVIETFSDEALKQSFMDLKQLFVDQAITHAQLLIKCYAITFEVIKRVLNVKLFLVQIIGAIVLNNGDIIEMKTGEGKTYTALLPIVFNALINKKVYLVTVNEYLVTRDCEENEQVFQFLGLSLGKNLASLNMYEKQTQYQQDIVYTTHTELCFDYLRDNLVTDLHHKVQQPLDFCLIDEVDSVLIDESWTPLIISGHRDVIDTEYVSINKCVKTLKKDDYTLDEETKQINLTTTGVHKIESYFKTSSLFSIANNQLFHKILNALRAHFVFQKHVEYIVENDKILLIDKFTGRILKGHAYSDGLQQAIQAKEKVTIENETHILSTITYQNFFRLFKKIGGMTGTAKTEEKEFVTNYNTQVVQIPTNLPMIRTDAADLFFKDKHHKYQHLLQAVKKFHTAGQPILIGTISVHCSTIVSDLLTKAKIKHEILNASNHSREAEIIAKAGTKKAVTVATNMAGRGTDIKLTPEVVKLGGLIVIGVEKHESRRIDHQLQGRSGRQGDPGWSQFLISLEDELPLRFGSDRLKSIFNIAQSTCLTSKMISRLIIASQKKSEYMNSETRNYLLEYDNLSSVQRNLVYNQRDQILNMTDTNSLVHKMITSTLQNLITKINWSDDEFYLKLTILIKNKFWIKDDINFKIDYYESKRILLMQVSRQLFNIYLATVADGAVTESSLQATEKLCILQILDTHWIEHLNFLAKLKVSASFKSYASENPLKFFTKEANEKFVEMKINIADEAIDKLFNLPVHEIELSDEL